MNFISLFYAAYELRCFTEARQNEYLEAQKEYRKSLPRHWKIWKQAQELNRIFHLDKIQQIRLEFPDQFELTARYVPVSQALKKNSEKFGNLLHSQREFLSTDGTAEIRSWLMKICSSAEECQLGNMLSPVLLDKSNGESIGRMSLKLKSGGITDWEERLGSESKLMSHVEYVDFATDL